MEVCGHNSLVCAEGAVSPSGPIGLGLGIADFTIFNKKTVSSAEWRSNPAIWEKNGFFGLGEVGIVTVSAAAYKGSV